VLDKWNEMSYNQFPSFDVSSQRYIYESWYEYLDGDTIYITEEYDMGEDECLD
jgi:hypothetical protein